VFDGVFWVQYRGMRTALVWIIRPRVVVISYGRFRTAYRSHLQVSGN